MNRKLEGLLGPKQNALVGKEKPRVLIISDPAGKSDCATRFSLTKQYLEDIGYYVLNKTRITFEDNLGALRIKPIHPAKKITIWYTAHGAPGWLFSSKPGIEEEERERNSFIRYVQSLSRSIKTSIDSIVLHSCYSATEYAKRNSSAYFVSPARFISFSFNDVPVVGFIGTNSSTCVSDVFLKADEGQFDPVLIKAVDGAVLFFNGEIRVAGAQPYFCNRSSIPVFLRAGTPLSQYFEICTRDYGNEEQKALASDQKSKSKGGFKFSAVTFTTSADDEELDNIRPLSKPAAESEVRGEAAHRIGVYMSVHEDSSTESTKQFASAVGSGKKSIAATFTTSVDDEELNNIMKVINNDEQSVTLVARSSVSVLLEPLNEVSVSHCPKLEMAASPTQKLSSFGLFASIATIELNKSPRNLRKSVSFMLLREECDNSRLSGMNYESPSKFKRSLLGEFDSEGTSGESTRSVRPCSR